MGNTTSQHQLTILTNFERSLQTANHIYPRQSIQTNNLSDPGDCPPGYIARLGPEGNIICIKANMV